MCFVPGVSANGLISVCNVLTRSQMVIGSVPSGEGARIGFSAEDYLMLEAGENIWIWPSISYDHRRPAVEGEQILDLTQPAEQGSLLARLIGIMRDSDLLGSAYVLSEDQSLLAVGYHSGQIQLWNAKEQQCVMEFTLGGGQIITASFSPGGELAAVGAGGPLIQLWRVAEERCVGVLHFDQPVRRVRFPETDRILECVYSDGQFARRDMDSGEVTVHQNPVRLLRIQKRLRRKLNGVHIQKLAVADNGNAIIVEKNSPRVWVWNEAEGVLNECRGHNSRVIDAEICRADPRYAASYSDERLGIGREIREPLKGQKVIRAWALRKGNCMQRLPTQRRTIRRLQFFTANRIILAAFAANGDIMLWELHNRIVSGVERGHWDPIEILKNAPAQPMECAVTQDAKTFIGAYADGTILKRSFQTNTSRSFRLFPGADLSALRWETLDGPDEVLETLKRYRQTES